MVDLLAKDVTLATLVAAQAGLTKRMNLITQNIANVNTPNYKRRDVAFGDELAAALGRPADDRAERVANLSQVVAREVVEERLFYRPDMGGVDIDREMVEFAKAQLKSSLVSQLLYEKIRQYRTVIKDGRV